MSLLRLASRLPRAAARHNLRCLSGSHSDFETVRKKVPATAEGVQAAVYGLAKPLFGVSVRPVLRAEVALAVLVLLIAVLLCYLFF